MTVAQFLAGVLLLSCTGIVQVLAGVVEDTSRGVMRGILAVVLNLPAEFFCIKAISRVTDIYVCVVRILAPRIEGCYALAPPFAELFVTLFCRLGGPVQLRSKIINISAFDPRQRIAI